MSLDSCVEGNFKIQACSLTRYSLFCTASQTLLVSQASHKIHWKLCLPWNTVHGRNMGKRSTDGQFHVTHQDYTGCTSNSEVWFYLTCHLGDKLPSGRKLVGLPSSKAKAMKISSTISCTMSSDRRSYTFNLSSNGTSYMISFPITLSSVTL